MVQLGGFCAAGMAVSCTSTGPAPGDGGGVGGPGAGGGPGGELPIVTLIAAFALRSMRTRPEHGRPGALRMQNHTGWCFPPPLTPVPVAAAAPGAQTPGTTTIMCPASHQRRAVLATRRQDACRGPGRRAGAVPP